MKKFTAKEYDIHERNEHCSERCVDVCLASDVAELERALREIVTDHTASDDGTVRLALIEKAKSLIESIEL